MKPNTRSPRALIWGMKLRIRRETVGFMSRIHSMCQLARSTIRLTVNGIEIDNLSTSSIQRDAASFSMHAVYVCVRARGEAHSRFPMYIIGKFFCFFFFNFGVFGFPMWKKKR